MPGASLNLELPAAEVNAMQPVAGERGITAAELVGP